MNKLTQQQKLLEQIKLRPEGLNSYFATYNLRIKQAPTRIFELREQGLNIQSIKQKDGSVNWVLNPKAKTEEEGEHYQFIGYEAVRHSGSEKNCIKCNPEPIQQSII